MILPFFFYNQHIVYEIIVAKQSKAQLYNIPWRQKIRTISYISQILKIRTDRFYEIHRFESNTMCYFKIFSSKLLK